MPILAQPVTQPALAPLVAPTLTGHSVHRTPITARRIGDAGDGPVVLVIGAIHGNEQAGIAVARQLMRERGSRGVRLWVLPNLNPDGTRAGTRGNAHDVDLNRNFAWRWQGGTAPGSTFYSGPAPLSEPESRFARRVALPLRHMIRYPGSATTWQTHRFPQATAFVVELPPGTLSARSTRAYARAVLAVARR